MKYLKLCSNTINRLEKDLIQAEQDARLKNEKINKIKEDIERLQNYGDREVTIKSSHNTVYISEYKHCDNCNNIFDFGEEEWHFTDEFKECRICLKCACSILDIKFNHEYYSLAMKCFHSGHINPKEFKDLLLCEECNANLPGKSEQIKN